MITHLNKKQLAFILDIKPVDARAKMCIAYAKSIGEKCKAYRIRKNIVGDDNYPQEMEISLLAEHLNIPTLQQSVDDIHENYLKRSATKKFILCDYPENKLRLKKEKGSNGKITIPTALKSLLPSQTVDVIKKEWETRFGIKA